MIGSRIKKIRIDNKMTQLELAKILNVSDRTVSKWEQLKGNPDIELLPKIADVFGVTCDFLLTGKNNKTPVNYMPESQDLVDYINKRIEPHLLSQKEAIILASMLQEYEYEFLKSCFLIAHGQIVSKEPSDEMFVSSLMSQIQKVAYARSRPLLSRKIGYLYYVYRNKKFDEFISKESFNKRIYYIFSKLNLTSDEDKINYVDNTLMPLVLNVLTKQELNDEFKKLLKKESAFDPNNNLSEEPVRDYSMIEKKINLMESVSPKTYLSLLRQGKRVLLSEQRLVDDLKRVYLFKNGVINAIIDYCAATSKSRITRPRANTIAYYLKSKAPKSAKEAIQFLVEYHKKELTYS